MANAVIEFLDTHVASGAADRPAAVTPDGSVTYRGLLELASRTGHVLRAFGVEPEQRVAMLLPDGLDWAATFFGALRLGAVAVPLNTRLHPADWVTMLRDSRAKVLVTDPTVARSLAGTGADLPHLKHVMTELPVRRAGAAAPLDPEPVHDDDTAFWLYTSGTTGGPKAAVHRHRDLLACRHYGREVLGASADDRVFATSRLFFAYALGNALLIPLFVGGRTFLHPDWPDPALVADIMRRFGPTLFFSVPTFYARLLRAGLPRDTFRSVRAAVSAGERLPAQVHVGWRERFGVEILDGLGATETIFMVLSNRPGQSRPGSAGTPVPGTHVRLLDEAGRDVEDGAPGVLHVRTPSASASYWNRLDQSRRAFVGEWFRTGDVFTRDADGFYYHAGRADDLFKVAGMWVVPAEIEAVLLSHPSVVEAAVVGAEEPGGLFKPFAFVVLRDNGAASPSFVDDLAALAARALPAHQRPRTIAIVDELPRTATGKLQRFRLRELVAPRPSQATAAGRGLLDPPTTTAPSAVLRPPTAVQGSRTAPS